MTLFTNGQQNAGGINCWRIDDMDVVEQQQQSGNYQFQSWTNKPIALIPISSASLAQMPAICAAIQGVIGV